MVNPQKRKPHQEVVFALMGFALTGFSLYKIYSHSCYQSGSSLTLAVRPNFKTSVQRKESEENDQNHDDLERRPASELERTEADPFVNNNQINSMHEPDLADTSEAIKTLVTTQSFFEEKESSFEDASLLVLATGLGFESISASSNQSQSLSLVSEQMLEANVGFKKSLNHELAVESGVLLTRIRYEDPISSQLAYGSGSFLNKGAYFRLHYSLSRSFHLIPFFEYKQRRFVTSLSSGSYALSSVWGPTVGLNLQWEALGDHKNRFYILAGGSWLGPGQSDSSDHRTKSGYSWNMGLRFQKIWQSFTIQIESIYSRLRQDTQLVHQNRQQLILGLQLNFKL